MAEKNEHRREAFNALITVTITISQLSALIVTALLAMVAAASASKIFRKEYLFNIWFYFAIFSFFLSIIVSIIILLRAINSIRDGDMDVKEYFYRNFYFLLLIFFGCWNISYYILRY